MITRSRSEHVPITDEAVTFNCLGVDEHVDHQPKTSFTFTWPGYTRNLEKMTPNSTGFRKDWKNFEHYKSVSGTPMNSLLPVYSEKWGYFPHISRGYFGNCQAGYHHYWSGSELAPYGSPGALNSGLPRWDNDLGDGHFVPDPASLDTLIARSLRAMLPGIKAELSLINSVIELKDFRGYTKLFKDIKGRIKNFSPTVSAWLRLAKNAPKATLKELSRKAAGGYLGWKFALQPLLSDICGIYTALSRTEARMNDLITRMGRRQVRHFCWNWVEYPDTYEVDTNPGYCYLPSSINTVGLYGVDRSVRYKPSTFHAEIEYNYYFTQYQLEHARVLSYLDAVGINPNPSIIWNALPWSFVVDWVVNVSTLLDSLKTRNMEPLINVRRFLWSIRRERSIYVTKGIVSPYYGLPPLARIPMQIVTETAYRRCVGIPEWSLFQTSGLSPNELSLGAALVIARRRRFHRRG